MSISWQHVLAFIVAVSLLVTIHEFGHYWVARLLGFKVLRFSVGFGRALYKKVAGADRTEYVIAAIPLGGYVKMLDEREGDVAPEELHRAFTRRPPWQRILVLLAGPAFNILFAIIVLAAMAWANGVTEVRAVVGDVTAGSVAQKAGLRSGDEILTLNGRQIAGQRDVLFGLLDGMSDGGRVAVGLRNEAGDARTVQLVVEDPAERRRLTEAEYLMRGLGFDFWRPPVPARLVAVEVEGPAGRAGLAAGDEILAVNGELVTGAREFRERIAGLAGQNALVQYRRDGSERTTRVEVPAQETGGKRIAVTLPSSTRYPDSMLRHTDLNAVEAIALGSKEAWQMTALQAQFFWRMLLGQVSLKNLSGPITIAEYAGDSAQAGATAFLGFLVLISLSLGFMNLLPIPMLDGGQIVYQLLEWAKGSPLSDRAQALGQQMGIALLVLLMGVALFNDIARQLG